MQSNINEVKALLKDQDNGAWYVHELRQAGSILDPGEIKVGGYYLYKEKYGMVAVVKVLDIIAKDDWVDFRLTVKRVLYSSWHIPKGTVFENGYHSKNPSYPSSWHFEPSILHLAG